MKVTWTSEGNLKGYLTDNWPPDRGDYFGGTMIAITYNPNNGEYTVISR